MSLTQLLARHMLVEILVVEVMCCVQNERGGRFQQRASFVGFLQSHSTYGITLNFTSCNKSTAQNLKKTIAAHNVFIALFNHIPYLSSLPPYLPCNSFQNHVKENAVHISVIRSHINNNYVQCILTERYHYPELMLNTNH